MEKEPCILVTNDDGMFAPGIKALVEVAREFGKIIVVAPDSPQSAKGHAVTMHVPLRINKVDMFEGVEAYECSGTPVDCVKLAKHLILKDRDVRLCVSGINHGSNASLNILYSGTISAAMEASIEGIQSIGFSLMNYSFDADFTGSKQVAAHIIKHVLDRGMGNCRLLNVNIPDKPFDQLNGIKTCRQAEGRWIEEFMEGVDPRGQKYYWLTGNFTTNDPGEDTDIHALENDFVSVVPSGHDLTRHAELSELEPLNTSF